MVRSTPLVLCSLLTAAAMAIAAPGRKPLVNKDGRDLAVRGYDVVAYVSGGAPAPGNSRFQYRWHDAVWQFVSAEHRDRFARSPEKYAPQFGGYCAWSVSRGYTADADPESWTIVDGKLYLNYSKTVQRRWRQDIPGNITRAEAHWPAVLEQ